MKRKTLRAAFAICLLAVLCQGCQWLQNEFFFLDRAPAPVLPAPGTDAQAK